MSVYVSIQETMQTVYCGSGKDSQCYLEFSVQGQTLLTNSQYLELQLAFWAPRSLSLL